MPPKDTDNPLVKAAPSGTVPKKLPIAPIKQIKIIYKKKIIAVKKLV